MGMPTMRPAGYGFNQGIGWKKGPWSGKNEAVAKEKNIFRFFQRLSKKRI